MAITLKNKTRKPEAGFTLLIAAIFMSVMLSFGIALASLGYKQQVLASLAIESQYAFYAANSAFECALWADLQQGLFTSDTPPSSAPAIKCDGFDAISSSIVSNADGWIIQERLSLDSGRCADVTIYEFPATTDDPGGPRTEIFSQGYNVPCAAVDSDARVVSRGIFGIN
jgi:hypothetical protein